MRRRVIVVVVGVLLLAAGAVVGVHLSRHPSEPLTESTLDAVATQMAQGEYQGAREELERLLAVDETNPEVHFNLALAYFNLGQYTAAREHFVRAAELDPERSGAVHHNLGVLAYQMGDLDTAAEEFEAALASDPSDPDTHYQLGAVFLTRAIPAGSVLSDPVWVERAEAEFNRALALEPGKPEALVGLANVHLLRKDVEAAIPLLEEALTERPNMQEALFALGQAYVTLGEVELAKDVLQRFLDTHPPDVWAEQAQEMLERLNP